MIYRSNHQTPTMSSTRKTSPRPQHRKLQSTASKSSASSSKLNKREYEKPAERCRGRCRVQWSEKHVKEGLVLVQEAQLARVVKTGPISEHYEIDPKPFASGQWARVYRCRSRSTGTLYAAKYSSRNRFNTDCSAELRHEIALLSLCSQSPRVVRLHDVYETPKEIILVMEFAPGGDLQTLIDGDLVPLEGDVVHFVKQLVEGLAYLHERNIAHLDIKPQNLVMMGTFPESQVKLCDFEISRVILEGAQVREILGTPDYVAPEILHYEPITLAADMWSLGVTTYVLLTGFSPFGGETDQETFQNIALGEVDFPEELFQDVSAQARDFVAKLLVLDPSARMSAKQCLRHDWLRDAPTQASPHLRRYLSKSREVLLERVVSRENLRRAALMSQATSHANLTETSEIQGCLGGSLSQSEMCLSHAALTASRASLEGSDDCYASPADSRTSLASSRTSLERSRASLATSQSYLLNKEQTQGLLNQAQSRSHANLNHVAKRGLLSRMRSLNHIQSQACLSQNSGATGAIATRNANDALFGGRSQEKLYGLRCLSKSQGVLDIYRSLECLRKKKKRRKEQRSVTEDILPIFRRNECEIESSSGSSASSVSLGRAEQSFQESANSESTSPTRKIESPKKNDETSLTTVNDDANRKSESEENFDSLRSVESDTLTEDSDETRGDGDADGNRSAVKQPSKRQNSSVSSHSNNSGNSEEKEEHSESENDEPKYTVAQLVSAFNAHQEVASKTSLEAIMTEKRVNEVTFPTGPKALRLFIPDIDITERGVVRRKTSYKPRKDWEVLRKQNEKNEGVFKDFDVDSGNEDVDRDSSGVTAEQIQNDENPPPRKNDFIEEADSEPGKIDYRTWPMADTIETPKDHLDTRIDEKYKQCVDGAKCNRPREDRTQKERLPNYIFADIAIPRSSRNNNARVPSEQRSDSSVNLRDILERMDASRPTCRENLEKLRKRTSITKIMLNDSMIADNDSNNNNNNGSATSVNRAKSEPPSSSVSSANEQPTKLNPLPLAFHRSSSLSSDGSCPTPSSVKSDGFGGLTWEDVDPINRDKDETDKTLVKKSSGTLRGKTASAMTPEERRVWGKVCTGSYTRAMEKFNGKRTTGDGLGRNSASLLSSGENTEKTRRKSSPAMSRCADS